MGQNVLQKGLNVIFSDFLNFALQARAWRERAWMTRAWITWDPLCRNGYFGCAEKDSLQVFEVQFVYFYKWKSCLAVYLNIIFFSADTVTFRAESGTFGAETERMTNSRKKAEMGTYPIKQLFYRNSHTLNCQTIYILLNPLWLHAMGL